MAGPFDLVKNVDGSNKEYDHITLTLNDDLNQIRKKFTRYGELILSQVDK